MRRIINSSSSSSVPSSTATIKKTTPCCSKVGIKRGPWTPEEDELLSSYVKREGEGRWRMLPKRAGLLRCGKSCRLRWMNYLRPSVKRGRIAPDEEDLILRLHRLLGNRWSLIAGRIPGRTDNEIKNYWNTHLSKKLINQGIDPRNHKPLNPNPNSSKIFNDPSSISNQKPNPNSVELEETSASYKGNITSQNLATTTPDDQFENQVFGTSNENWLNFDGDFMTGYVPSSHGHCNEENEIQNCNEDTFSSFLDSLINDNMFVNHHQQQQPNMIAQTFNHGSTWEAEGVSTMAAFGNHEQSGFNNHHA